LRVPAYIAWPTIVAAAYGALYFFANRSIYFPSKYPEGLWDNRHQVNASDVWIDTRDGVRLHTWFVAREGARWVTLYLHGNAGNVTHRLPHIQEIVAAGSSILILDYRGYGKSSGRPTEQGLYIDSDAAYQHLLEVGYRAEHIIVHGESLGTAVAIDLASRRPCAALILEAPFTSASDVAGTVIPILGPLLVHSYNSVSKIGRIAAPKLFIQGDHDEVIQPRLAQSLYAKASAPKEFWVVEGAAHNDIVETAGTGYRLKLEQFYRKLAADERR
jgi:uncharacterized protein